MSSHRQAPQQWSTPSLPGPPPTVLPGPPPSLLPGDLVDRSPRTLAEEGIAALRRAENAQQEANSLRTRVLQLMANNETLKQEVRNQRTKVQQVTTQNETLKQEKARLEKRAKQLEQHRESNDEESVEYYRDLTVRWEKYGSEWEQEAQSQRRRADETAGQLRDAMKELERWRFQSQNARTSSGSSPTPVRSETVDPVLAQKALASQGRAPAPLAARRAEDEPLIRLSDMESDSRKPTVVRTNSGDSPQNGALGSPPAVGTPSDGPGNAPSEPKPTGPPTPQGAVLQQQHSSYPPPPPPDSRVDRKKFNPKTWNNYDYGPGISEPQFALAGIKFHSHVIGQPCRYSGSPSPPHTPPVAAEYQPNPVHIPMPDADHPPSRKKNQTLRDPNAPLPNIRELLSHPGIMNQVTDLMKAWEVQTELTKDELVNDPRFQYALNQIAAENKHLLERTPAAGGTDSDGGETFTSGTSGDKSEVPSQPELEIAQADPSVVTETPLPQSPNAAVGRREAEDDATVQPATVLPGDVEDQAPPTSGPVTSTDDSARTANRFALSFLDPIKARSSASVKATAQSSLPPPPQGQGQQRPPSDDLETEKASRRSQFVAVPSIKSRAQMPPKTDVSDAQLPPRPRLVPGPASALPPQRAPLSSDVAQPSHIHAQPPVPSPPSVAAFVRQPSPSASRDSYGSDKSYADRLAPMPSPSPPPPRPPELMPPHLCQPHQIYPFTLPPPPPKRVGKQVVRPDGLERLPKPNPSAAQEECRRIQIKNAPREWTEADLLTFFERLVGFKAVYHEQRKFQENAQQRTWFVDFKTRRQAKRAAERADGHLVEGVGLEARVM